MTCEDAIQEIKHYINSDCYADAPSNDACKLAIRALALFDTLNLYMRHGEWLPVDDALDAFDCSECDAMVQRKHNYCPKCGAKMDTVMETHNGE